MAFNSFTVVVAGRWGKVRGLETPADGDTMIRVKVVGSGRSSSLVEASVPVEVSTC